MCEGPPLSQDEQLAALTPDVVREYAQGRLTWRQIRDELNVDNFRLVLQRLGEEGLKLPRASADRPTKARGWLLDAIRQTQVLGKKAAD